MLCENDLKLFYYNIIQGDVKENAAKKRHNIRM